jgi:hypothetical protein
MQKREDLVPGFVPESLVEEGLRFHFSMAHLQPDSIAWKKDAVIQVIETLADHAYAMLGGDVLRLSEGQLAYSGDYWDLLDEDVVLWEEYVEYAKERSIDFIEGIARARGESLVYAIFFINEHDYKEQMRNFGNIRYR